MSRCTNANDERGYRFLRRPWSAAAMAGVHRLCLFAFILLWRFGLIRRMVASDRIYISSIIRTGGGLHELSFLSGESGNIEFRRGLRRCFRPRTRRRNGQHSGFGWPRKSRCRLLEQHYWSHSSKRWLRGRHASFVRSITWRVARRRIDVLSICARRASGRDRAGQPITITDRQGAARPEMDGRATDRQLQRPARQARRKATAEQLRASSDRIAATPQGNVRRRRAGRNRTRTGCDSGKRYRARWDSLCPI